MAKLNCSNDLKRLFLDLFYPVGTYYETSDGNFNPNTQWGGTWIEDTGGRVTLGAGHPSKNNGTDTSRGEIPDYALDWYFPVNGRGGQFDHQLTIDEMPSHHHDTANDNDENSSGKLFNSITTMSTRTWKEAKYWWNTTSTVGGNKQHNIVQPYIVVKRWHRIA